MMLHDGSFVLSTERSPSRARKNGQDYVTDVISKVSTTSPSDSQPSPQAQTHPRAVVGRCRFGCAYTPRVQGSGTAMPSSSAQWLRESGALTPVSLRRRRALRGRSLCPQKQVLWAPAGLGAPSRTPSAGLIDGGEITVISSGKPMPSHKPHQDLAAIS